MNWDDNPEPVRAHLKDKTPRADKATHYDEKVAVDCWLCGGASNQTCNCHNHPPGRKAAPCNMVCN